MQRLTVAFFIGKVKFSRSSYSGSADSVLCSASYSGSDSAGSCSCSGSDSDSGFCSDFGSDSDSYHSYLTARSGTVPFGFAHLRLVPPLGYIHIIPRLYFIIHLKDGRSYRTFRKLRFGKEFLPKELFLRQDRKLPARTLR